MQYNNYLEKIKKIAAFLSKLYRHMIIVAVGIVVIAVSVSSMVAAKGTITEEGECPAEVIYGELPTYEVDAVFGKVSFEYCEKGSGQWSEEAPVGVGEYSVRAVTKAAFGAHKYGREQSFTIKPREIVLGAKENRITYGESLTPKADNLHRGDSISCDFVYEDITASNTNVKADAASVKIVSSSGADMTANYIIVDTPSTALTFLPRALTITVDSETKIYDNTPLVSDCKGYEAKDGGLVNGDYVLAVGTPAEITEVGNTENTYKFTPYTSDGRNISSNYRISVIPGTLTVEKRPLYIETPSDSKVYDAEVLSNTGYKLDSDATAFLLAQGHSLNMLSNASLTDCGTIENAMNFAVSDSQGASQMNNYSMFVTLGTLSVTKRPITVKTDSASFVYNGEAHGVGGYFVVDDGKEYGYMDYKFQITGTRAEITNVGSAQNSFDISMIQQGESKDIQSNFDISYDFGTLTVTPLEITVSTENETFSYTASANSSKKGYTVTVNSNGYTSEQFLQNFKLFGTYTQVTNVTTSPFENRFDITKIMYRNMSVDMGNFDISYDFGTITVTKAAVLVRPRNPSWTYGEYAPTELNYTVITTNSEYQGLVSNANHQIKVAFEFKEIAAGTYTPSVSVDDITIWQGSENVTGNYNVALYNRDDLNTVDADGAVQITVTIEKRNITLAVEDKTVVYDAEEHSITEYVIRNNEKWQYNDKDIAEKLIKYYGKRTIKGTEECGITPFTDSRITDNYEIEYESATLTITPRPIKIITESNDKTVYDAEGHRFKNFVVQYDSTYGKIDGHEISIVDDKYVPSFVNAGTYTEKNEHSVIIKDGNGEVTDNYDIDYDYGTITIKKRPIVVYTESPAPFVYDAVSRPFIDFYVDYDEKGYAQIIAHTPIIVNDYESFVNAGAHENKHSIVINDARTTENYDITYRYGTVVINKRPIGYMTESATVTYDGNEHKFIDVIPQYATDYPKLSGHTMSAVNYLLFRNANESGYENIHDVIIMYGDEDVTKNYDIAKPTKWGKIVISKRDVSILINVDDKVYDGVSLDYSDNTGLNLPSWLDYTSSRLIDADFSGIHIKCTSCKDGCRGDWGEHTLKLSVDWIGINASNYNLHCEQKTVTVEKRALAVSPQKSITQHIYDSTNPQFRGTSNIALSNPLAEGQSLSAVTYFTGVNCNGNVGTYGVKFTEIVIVDADGVDVTHNYDIVSVETVGYSIKINPRPITIVASDIDAVEYNGKAHVSDKWEYDINTEYRLVSGHEIYAVVECKGHEDETFCVHGTSTKCCGCVGKHPLVIKSHTLVGTDENNYTIKYSTNTGYCEVVPRDVKFVSESKSWQYDGNKHWHNEYTEYGSGIVDGQTATLSFKGFGPDVGKGENEFDVIGIYDANDLAKEYNLKSNYNITQTNGTLIIYEKVVITFNWTVTQQYNGNVFDYNDMQNMWTSNIQGVDFKLGMLNVGKVYVRDGKLVTEEGKEYTGYTVKVTVGGVDITDGCEITFECSFDESLPVMEIVPYEITLTAPTEEHIYNADKTAIENLDQFEAGVEITKGKLLSGHRWEILKYEYENGVVPTAGAPAVTVVYEYNYKIFDAENIDVTENYLIHCVNGVHSFAADDTEQATE